MVLMESASLDTAIAQLISEAPPPYTTLEEEKELEEKEEWEGRRRMEKRERVSTCCP